MVGWRSTRPPASASDLADLEREVGELPQAYGDFLREQDGGEPEQNEFEIPGSADDSVNVRELLR